MNRAAILIKPIRAWATRHLPYLRDRTRREKLEAERTAHEAHAEEICRWLALFAQTSESLAEQWSARRANPPTTKSMTEGQSSDTASDFSGRAGLFQGIGRVNQSLSDNAATAPHVKRSPPIDSRWLRTNLQTNNEGFPKFTLRCCITCAQIHVNVHPLVPAIGDTRWDCFLDLSDFVEAIDGQVDQARIPSELQWFKIVVFDGVSEDTVLEYITACAAVVLDGESTLPPWDYVAIRRRGSTDESNLQ